MSRAGTILRVDLTDGRIEKEPTSRYARDYIGGPAIGSRIIYENVPPDIHGNDPRNILTINTGPLTGTILRNKCNIVTKSPKITNSPIVTAGMGGQFPSEIKFAGYDNIAITGKAAGPVYLYISNDTIEIRDARHLWGLDTEETQVKIKEELRDPEVQVACINQPAIHVTSMVSAPNFCIISIALKCSLVSRFFTPNRIPRFTKQPPPQPPTPGTS